MVAVDVEVPADPFVLSAADHPAAQVTELHAVLRRRDIRAAVVERGYRGQLRQSTLRSLWWRCLLGCLPCEDGQRDAMDVLDAWLQSATQQREFYHRLQRQAQQREFYHRLQRQMHPAPPSTNCASNLSESEANAGAAVDQIQKDLCRLFLDDATSSFLQSVSTQRVLTNILAAWAQSSPTGYQQGMHEVLALIYLVVVRDAQRRHREEQLVGQGEGADGPLLRLFQGLHSLLNVEHCEADTFALFDALVRTHGLGQWFTTAIRRVSRRGAPEALQGMGTGEEELSAVVRECRRIQQELLPREAPRLAEHLCQLEIEPQVYTMKWLRLLFLRDFPVEDTLMVWDTIFTDVRHTGALTLAPWLAVVLLLYMEQDLLASGEYDYCVKRLMTFRHVEGAAYFIWEAVQLAHPAGLPFLRGLHAPKVSHYHPLAVRKRAKAVQLNLFEEAQEAEGHDTAGAPEQYDVLGASSLGELRFGEAVDDAALFPDGAVPVPVNSTAAALRGGVAPHLDFFRDDSDGDSEAQRRPPRPRAPPTGQVFPGKLLSLFPSSDDEVDPESRPQCTPVPQLLPACSSATPPDAAATVTLGAKVRSLFDDSDEDTAPPQGPTAAPSQPPVAMHTALGRRMAHRPTASLFEDSDSDTDEPKPGSPTAATAPTASQLPSAQPTALACPATHPSTTSLFEDSGSDTDEPKPGAKCTPSCAATALSSSTASRPPPSLFEDSEGEEDTSSCLRPSTSAGLPSAASPVAQAPPPRLRLADIQHHTACRAIVGSPELSDVVLALDGGAMVPAHRLFLAVGSQTLRQRLQALPPGEALPVVGCSRTSVLQVLELLYTGEVDIAEAELPALQETARMLGLSALTERWLPGSTTGAAGTVGMPWGSH
eukprot:GGOE01044690.1.p1 GENE.GGOE01044690.1~~GGOE01044690.1.p1  ORF type:complete len:881 (-),score=195.77 GGOE01044690.1:257-2899(-)